MLLQEGQKILELPATYTQDDVDKVYAAKYRTYLLRSQHAATPEERDVAHRALSYLKTAYQCVTGRPHPDRLSPATSRSASSSCGRRAVTMASWQTRVSGPASATQQKASQGPAGAVRPCARPYGVLGLFWPLSGESLIGTFIYAAMCLIALLILAKAGTSSP